MSFEMILILMIVILLREMLFVTFRYWELRLDLYSSWCLWSHCDYWDTTNSWHCLAMCIDVLTGNLLYSR